MRPFLIIQLRPEDEVADDEFRAILEHGGLASDEVVRVRVDRDELPGTDPSEWAAIIVGGSPFEVTTPGALKSETQRRVEARLAPLLDRVLAADAPFLGACSGHGLLAGRLGVPMSGRWAETVGASRVSVTEAGRRDPLLAGFPPDFGVLLGHKEALDGLPAGATLLARSPACPIQMFRLGENVYSTQFHPEGDADGFSLRIRYYRHHGYFPPEAAADRLAEVDGFETPWANAILRRFVERYRDGAAGER